MQLNVKVIAIVVCYLLEKFLIAPETAKNLCSILFQYDFYKV